MLVVLRLERRDPPTRGSDSDSAAVAVASVALRVGTGLDAPLRAAPFPGDAVAIAPLVAPAAPRMVHGGPRHTHRSSARGPARPEVRWRVNVGGAVSAQVTASPDGQTLYVGTHEGSLVALGRLDGVVRWRTTLGERVYSTPLVADDGTVYVGSDAKKLAAIGKDGGITWRLEVDGEVDSGAVFAKDGTIVFAAGANVYCARRGGDLAWRFSTKGKVFTAPAITDDGLVIVGAQDHRVRALTPGGALAWEVDLGADVDGAAAISDDGFVHVGTDKGEVVRLDAKGKVVWRTPVGGFVRGVLSIGRDGDVLVGTYGPVPRVVRIAPDGVLRGALAIPGTGAREFGVHGGPLEDAEGTLFFGAQDDLVRAIGRAGDERWRFPMGADVDAPVTMLEDGALVVASEDGTVAMLLP